MVSARLRLSILAGHDPSGGAGIRRDVLTARSCAPTVALRTAVTAWTSQGDGRPARAWARALPCIQRELLRDGPTTQASAVKLGLIPGALVSHEFIALLTSSTSAATVVLDPVLGASAGGSLGARPESYRALARALARRAGGLLVTPNLSEARALLGVSSASFGDDALARLSEALGGASVLVKDGHGEDAERVRDRLWHAGAVLELDRPRTPGPDPRGTGCALATAIACGLALGASLPDAVAAAVRWLDRARVRSVPRPDGTWHLRDRGPRLSLDGPSLVGGGAGP
ncbi:MAG: bifunctional hydroxymethylpyrimidine kinase/phosphomethylpyrimidine kinase [Myxococcales bacterium]|nr:bifunctional hydroxymethylpyrimidine kinase/phosphomethylpyrimidine kinase [Myxococcales bacterium]